MRLMSLVFVMFAFLSAFALVAPSRAADAPPLEVVVVGHGADHKASR